MDINAGIGLSLAVVEDVDASRGDVDSVPRLTTENALLRSIVVEKCI